MLKCTEPLQANTRLLALHPASNTNLPLHPLKHSTNTILPNPQHQTRQNKARIPNNPIQTFRPLNPRNGSTSAPLSYPAQPLQSILQCNETPKVKQTQDSAFILETLGTTS
ncbi:hypothetical protein BD289DRAFT_447507 [Coniella lustricola]|uniref:Uncharacterized protein n=1 Tax=Coniella lustricola TaxID=2025994 RepID=A0A2T2ZT16_9PEZI|nr:hypothetical protein BD289DRAFT_447507 [Coniella lustricola]